MFNNLVLGQTIDHPEEVGCYDGLVIIIGTEKTERFFIDGEHDECVSLADIAEKYPDVYIVIIEDFLSGGVFRYGNYKVGQWNFTGKTIGFA